MARRGSFLTQRSVWVTLSAVFAAALWVVTVGVGWRAWLVTEDRYGIVGHVDSVGRQVAPWMITAAIMSLTTVVMMIGVAIVRHLVDGPVEPQPELDELPELEPVPPKVPLPELSSAD